MIKFKQFHSMPPKIISLLASTKHGKEWIHDVLPGLWSELCTSLGLRAGVVVLKAEGEDSFYESASFGYGEDGFYYSFLNRGSELWNDLMSSLSPLDLSDSGYDLFLPQGKAMALRIESSSDPIGFLLIEWEEDLHFPGDLFLHLFAERISKEWVEPKLSARQSLEVGETFQSFRNQIPNLDHYLEQWRLQKRISILGPKGIGKKSLAKWIHQITTPGRTFLLIESLPENFGKLEKALQVWAEEAGSGSLVFNRIEHLSLGQQQIFLSWLAEGKFSGNLILIGPAEWNSELLPEFENLVQKDALGLPSLSLLTKPKFKEMIHGLFSELALTQNRGGLSLSPAALDHLVSKVYPENFTELKNILLTAILTTRSNQIDSSDLEIGKSRMDLEVPEAEDLDLRRGIQALERQKILHSMRIFSGNQIRMAKALGISRGSLQYKMKQLGLL
ncbi:helix-turn-helix domain-containing protein [Leptospira sp. 96542]|nr:helix-turn-helix domain-containing protein [Leptospira sp. 96542]